MRLTEAAKTFRVNERTLRRWATTGVIPSKLDGKTRWVKASDVIRAKRHAELAPIRGHLTDDR